MRSKDITQEAQSRIDPFLQSRLDIKECVELQKKHLATDLIWNPLNALWAIPYLGLKKAAELSEKLGWETIAQAINRLPASFKTGYQREIEKAIAEQVFAASTIPGSEKAIVKKEVSEFAGKLNKISDLVSSVAVVIASDRLFGDKSLDVFGLGKKIAGLWAKDDAANQFFLGKELGRAFYSIAAPPPPSTMQVLLVTTGLLFALAALSTLVSALSIPLQKKLGITSKQLGKLVESTGDKLLLEEAKRERERKSPDFSGINKAA